MKKPLATALWTACGGKIPNISSRTSRMVVLDRDSNSMVILMAVWHI
jgi:hypothetical protein